MFAPGSLRFLANAVRRRPANQTQAGTPSNPSWISTVSSVEADLKELNRSTEADFLAIGGMLTQFISSARQISSELSGMSEVISGENGEATCRALESVLLHAKQMQENAGSTRAKLAQLSELVILTRNEFSGFNETSSLFQVVATLARIETERLGSANSNLGHLADEFRSHTANVLARVSEVLNAVVALDARLRSTIDKALGLQEQELQTFPSLITGIQGNLTTFRMRREQAVAASAKIASQFGSVSAAIKEIVGSIQFHDITRQQIEHVEQALAEMRQPDAHGVTGSPSSAQGTLLRVQCAQIDAAERLFSSSVRDIDRQLESISSQIRTIIVDHRALLDADEATGDTFLLEMQRSFEGILVGVNRCGHMEESVAAAMGGVNEVLDHLNTSVGEIRTMALQLKRLAINARISSIHLGAIGEPLSVISEAMQGLQADCETRCNETESHISAMKHALAPAPAEMLHALRSAEEIETDVRARITELHSSSQASGHSWKRVNDSAESLRTGLETARDRLTVGLRASETLHRCSQSLLPFAAVLAGSAGDDADLKMERFEQTAQRYTMQAEREIHEQLTGKRQPSPAEEIVVAPPAPAESGEFGDNIELF